MAAASITELGREVYLLFDTIIQHEYWRDDFEDFEEWLNDFHEFDCNSWAKTPVELVEMAKTRVEFVSTAKTLILQYISVETPDSSIYKELAGEAQKLLEKLTAAPTCP